MPELPRFDSNVRERPDLIALAQKLARDAEHHALLAASLASQAERLMIAGRALPA